MKMIKNLTSLVANQMRTFNHMSTAILALALTALVITAAPAKAGVITAHGGEVFALTPTDDPNVFRDTVDGTAQVSLLGNCSFHAEQTISLPSAPGEPISVKGSWRFTTADSATTLDMDVEGTGAPDPANPGFVNIKFKVRFAGGTGLMASVRGSGELEGVAMFSSPTAGIATWTLKGNLSTHGQKSH
jgi:hypothetical protein